MPNINVEMNIGNVVRVHEDHGGYTAGNCLACGASGWINGRYGLKHTSPDAKEWRGTHLVHKKNCPMNQYASERRDR